MIVPMAMLTFATATLAAEVELGETSFGDGLASAFVIVRNNDQSRGYASVTVDCIFSNAGRPVGEATDEIKDLQYREHVAARLSAPIDGDTFDRAVCTIAGSPGS